MYCKLILTILVENHLVQMSLLFKVVLFFNCQFKRALVDLLCYLLASKHPYPDLSSFFLALWLYLPKPCCLDIDLLDKKPNKGAEPYNLRFNNREAKEFGPRAMLAIAPSVSLPQYPCPRYSSQNTILSPRALLYHDTLGNSTNQGHSFLSRERGVYSIVLYILVYYYYYYYYSTIRYLNIQNKLSC